MKEFMTRLSDYINERRNDPERRESKLAFVLLGAVALIIIVLLLLLLWRYAARNQEIAETDSEYIGTEYIETQGQEKMEEYMAELTADEEALRQEYLTSAAYLREQVEELLKRMTGIQESLSDTVESYQEENGVLQTQIAAISEKVNHLVQELKETQVKVYDLNDLVQVINKETLPIIREQIANIQKEIEQVHTDIAEIYTEIAALKTEDEKLWEGIKSLETEIKAAMDTDLADMADRLNGLSQQMESADGRLQGRLEKLMSRILMYRYDETDNTLYLLPYEE